MCSTTMNTLAALQTAVLQGPKIDSPENTGNTNMQDIIQRITEFVQDAENHNSAALDDFKKLEQFIADQRRTLATNVSAAEKTAAADERRAEAGRKADAKRREKEDAAANRKIVADRKKATKAALLKLNKFLKKPKSPIAGKDDEKVLKWAMVGAKTNYAPVKKAANKAAREAKKAQKEADAAERKIANAGKPKNADYARFCKYLQADAEQIAAAGCANKRDYNKEIWADGDDLFRELLSEKGVTWDDFKKSPDAPWNQ